VKRKWILGALVCALVPVGARAQVELSKRSDGVFVLSNNPDKPRPALVPALPGRGRWSSTLVVPRELRQRITDHALARDLDPRLVEALIRVESAFNTRAVSDKGAMGLMQLMPSTALELGVEDAFDVEENLRGGTAYLRSLLDRFSGNLTLALAGYNAGPGAVEKYRGVPPYRETTDYVQRVLAAYGGAPKSRMVISSSTKRSSSARAGGTRLSAASLAVAAPAVSEPRR
jgi:hypothetical protein